MSAPVAPLAEAGEQRTEDLAAHEARAAVRRLVTGWFDAWDAGDLGAAAAAFVADGTFVDPAGRTSRGGDVAAGLAAWRAWEPVSLTWVSNEQVEVAPGALTAAGTWLWLSASMMRGGTTAAWSGGDLRVEARSTPAGWRLSVLAFDDRYRTPYGAGWLAEPHAAAGPPGPAAVPRAPGAVAGAIATEGLDAPPLPRPAPDTADRRADALAAEADVRAVVAGYLHGAEVGADVAALAGWWLADGTYHPDDATPVRGHAAIAAALAAERAAVSSWICPVTSEWIEVDGERAHVRCRDLWTAEREGEARWLAHAYRIALRREGGTWRFEDVRRIRVLDCTYRDGWDRAHGQGGAG